MFGNADGEETDVLHKGFNGAGAGSAPFGVDPDFVAADRIRDESHCVLRYERTFMRPLLPADE